MDDMILLEEYLDYLHEGKLTRKFVGFTHRVFTYPHKKIRQHRKKKWDECEAQYRKNPSPELRRKCDLKRNSYYKIAVASQRKKYDPNLKKKLKNKG